ncbi:MAG: hypothetical protein COT74_02215 [Bdellovibrionales bacterium CG10_big_fil_rev_8_21_14_0_10_45_34]|nr:MAG: hypothetical protein COT74_02215 [Bdellovibrionales bacterium CG10_big_fil_rev_8_21_14_0_10_45_34]
MEFVKTNKSSTKKYENFVKEFVGCNFFVFVEILSVEWFRILTATLNETHHYIISEFRVLPTIVSKLDWISRT